MRTAAIVLAALAWGLGLPLATTAGATEATSAAMAAAVARQDAPALPAAPPAPAAPAAPAAPTPPLASLRPATGFAAQGEPATSRARALRDVGYTEAEWRLTGRAQAYAARGEWAKDGRWAIQPRGGAQAYDTRVLVRRPADPARFNGIVLVEWLNTSLGFDLDGAWALNRDEIIREGYAWVGVSAESASAQSLKAGDARRYADIRIADNAWSYDIYTQAAGALRQAAATWSARPGTPVRVLALGYSQSGSYLITYINAFQPTTRAFDGFYTMSTAAVGMPIDEDGGRIFNTAYRPDLNAPVMQVSTEMEVVVGWQLSKTPDTPRLRHWEMAGATHLDRYMQEAVLAAGHNADKLALPHCWKPSNTLPSRMFNHAALDALKKWVTAGTPPPIAPRMVRSQLGFVQDDEIGNARGGLRLPELDVPLAQYGHYSNVPTQGFSQWSFYACMAGGSANPLSAGQVHARYADQAAYVAAYQRAADRLLAQGFLRPADYDWLIEQARARAWPR